MLIETVIYVVISENIVEVKCKAIIDTLTRHIKETTVSFLRDKVPDESMEFVCASGISEIELLYEGYQQGFRPGLLSSSRVQADVMEIPSDPFECVDQPDPVSVAEKSEETTEPITVLPFNHKDTNEPNNQKETRRMRYYKEYWQLPLADIEEVSVRTQNWMIRSNINTLKDLSMLRIDDLASSRNMGLKSIMELIMLLYRYGLEFRGNVQRMMSRHPFKTQSMESLLDDGYEPLTHPYNDDERHMIHFILKDMEEGGIDALVGVDDEGRYIVMRKGLTHVTDEEGYW